MVTKITIHPTTTITLQTSIPVEHNDLESVKKALAAWLKLKGFPQHAYLHNHEHEGDPDFTKQTYPLLQLRCVNNTLQLWGMQDGAQILQQLMMTEMLRGFQYKGAQFRINANETKVQQNSVGLASDTLYEYELNYFIAFTPGNFKSWQQLPTAAQRMQRLEELLVNNITMFCKAAGYSVDKSRVRVQIYWVWHTRWALIKGHKVLAFTLSYSSNVLMPDGIALGRQTRLGYGWQTLRNPAE